MPSRGRRPETVLIACTNSKFDFCVRHVCVVRPSLLGLGEEQQGRNKPDHEPDPQHPDPKSLSDYDSPSSSSAVRA